MAAGAAREVISAEDLPRAAHAVHVGVIALEVARTWGGPALEVAIELVIERPGLWI